MVSARDEFVRRLFEKVGAKHATLKQFTNSVRLMTVSGGESGAICEHCGRMFGHELVIFFKTHSEYAKSETLRFCADRPWCEDEAEAKKRNAEDSRWGKLMEVVKLGEEEKA